MSRTPSPKPSEQTLAGEHEQEHVAPDLLKPPTATIHDHAASSTPSSSAGPSRDPSVLEKSTVDPPVADEKATPAPEHQDPPRQVKGFVWGLVVVAILSSTFLFALDNTVVADVQPAIIQRFGDIAKLPWLSVAFLLGAVSTNLIWGKIYGQFNAKYLYLITTFLFEAGSAICGASNTMDALIVGRAIAGLGGAGMYVGVMTLLSVTTTPHERPMYIGLTGLTWGAGTVLGPIIGGAFTDSKATWRWAFYINLVIFAIFAPVYLFLLPSIDPRPGVPLRRRARQLDYVGTILSVGAFITGVMAISFGGTTYPWRSSHIIGLFVGSGLLFISFGLQQAFSLLTTPEHRIFPVHFMSRPIMLILFAMTSAAVTTAFLPIYFIPLFFQFVRSDTALDAGVRLLPFVCLLVFFCLLNGALMSKYGYYMPWYLFGGLMGVIGAALMYTVDKDSSTSRIYGYSVILAIGSGAFCQASFSVAQAKVEPHDIPLAVGFITLAQILGATISLAIANSIFLNQSANQIVALLPNVPFAEVQSAIAGAGSNFFNTLTDESRQQVLDILVGSIKKTYILPIVAGSLAVILSLFMPRERIFLEAGGAG